MAGTNLTRSNPQIPGGPESHLPAASQSLAGTMYFGEDTDRMFRCRDDGTAWDVVAEPAKVQQERGLVIGKSGGLSSAADAADFPLVLPFDLTLVRLKAICATPPGGALVVQLRYSTNSGVSYSDVSGFAMTFAPGAHIATASPTAVQLAEGNVLNLSLSNASGSNLLVEVVGLAR